MRLLPASGVNDCICRMQVILSGMSELRARQAVNLVF